MSTTGGNFDQKDDKDDEQKGDRLLDKVDAKT